MGERAINLNQQLNYIEQLFSSGQIKKAQKDLRKLNTQFGRDKPIPSKFKHRFQRLNFTAKEFDDWAEFATSDKRTELINKVGSLANHKLEPRKLANKIIRRSPGLEKKGLSGREKLICCKRFVELV